MEITTRQAEGGPELVLSGRLDAYWSEHLSKALDEAVRSGTHHLRLDMSAVPYMSSVGIRVLLRFFKETQRLGGSFAILRPSEEVRHVLDLAGLDALLGSTPAKPAAAVRAASQVLERATATFEIFELAPGPAARCRVIGDAAELEGWRYTTAHGVPFPAERFGVGVGAFGSSFEDCRTRFGEFLAVAGAAAYLPTDGSKVPDLSVAAGDLVPEVQALYALVCDSSFSKLARFEAKAGAVSLSELVGEALALAGSRVAGIVLVAETVGLMGAALRRSPAAPQKEGAALDFPQVREWLSFTPERAFERSLAVVVGIATREEDVELAPFLRPLGAGAQPAGHFHAAAFGYRALAKGAIDLAATIDSLFSGEQVQGVLHLLGDDRPGGMESDFLRGACWIAPVASVETGR